MCFKCGHSSSQCDESFNLRYDNLFKSKEYKRLHAIRRTKNEAGDFIDSEILRNLSYTDSASLSIEAGMTDFSPKSTDEKISILSKRLGALVSASDGVKNGTHTEGYLFYKLALMAIDAKILLTGFIQEQKEKKRQEEWEEFKLIAEKNSNSSND
jgi:hypothetical protein